MVFVVVFVVVLLQANIPMSSMCFQRGWRARACKLQVSKLSNQGDNYSGNKRHPAEAGVEALNTPQEAAPEWRRRQ